MSEKSLPVLELECPSGFGKVNRDTCYQCKYSSLGDCPTGAYFVWKPWEVDLYKNYIHKPLYP